MKLACFDMDGVIFKSKNFWLELHKRFGTYEEGKKLTEQYLHNNYAKLVEEVVVKLWKGKDATQYYELVRNAEYVDGAADVISHLRSRKILTALITTGPKDLARRAQDELGIDCIYANELAIKDNKVSGEFIWPLGHGGEEKVKIVKELMHRLGLKWEDVSYVGDHDNDIEVCKKAGLAIGFNPSEKLEKECEHIVRGSSLKEVLNYIK
ncbi:MAG: HAD family phosphatase [Candidatus Woesearchaeota archaeon]